jgi:hypothetical protein
MGVAKVRNVCAARVERAALAAFAAAASAFAPPASAHHSVSAWFDTTSALTELEGEVTEMQWQNPHVIFTMRVVDTRGRNVDWAIETLSISGIQRWGITQELFGVGDQLKVAGNPSRRNSNNLFVRNILLPGGREIVLSGAPRWSQQTLRASEVLQAQEGDTSRPELGVFRTWSSGSGGGFLFPEALDPRFDFSRYPLTSAAKAALAAFDFAADDPTNGCTPKGMPTIMEQPYPLEFVDEGARIQIRMEEYDTLRTIHMDAAGAAAESRAAPERNGYSVGRWEGRTLVVTTTKASWGHFDSVGIPLSAAAVIVERFTPSEDGARLDYSLTVTDAATFTAPVEMKKFWIWRPEVKVERYACTAVG